MKKLILLIIIFLCILIFIFQEKKFEGDTIFIGSSLPETGTMKEYGKAVKDGANAYFNYVNQNNLLEDKKIEFITYDDKYEPRLTILNTKKLLKNEKIFTLYGLVGTPTVKNILPIVNQTDIPLISTFSGASFLRNCTNPHIVNFRNSYKDEIQSHIKYLYEKKGFTKIAVFYQNDEYGEDGYVSVVKILKQYNLTPVGEGSYKRNTLSIRHAFNSIKDANPEAIIMIGANKANTLFIKKAKQHKNFNNTLFSNISFGDATEMIKNLNGEGRNIIFSQIVPNYQNSDLPIIKEYQNILKQYDKNLQTGFISLEAYLSAKLLVKAIQNIKGPITRAKFVANIKKLPKKYLDKIYLFQYHNQEFKEIIQ
ncbi:ABC transporter substrate-binding protein [Arcobacter sp. 15-2]|uniref:ABC transporter substrate-binding protein n=1 Tax=Arcobacter sp. 15-2 TaxID=3374109 RepID=UPI00399D3ACB